MQEPTSPGSTSSSNHSPDVQNKVPLRGEVASVQVFEMLPGQLQLEEMIAHKLERFTTILESLDPDGCGFSSCEQFSRACKALPWCRSSPMPPLAAIHELFDRLANPDSLVENDGTILGQLLQMRADVRRRASMASPATDEEEEYRAFLLSQERAARRAKHQQQSRAAGSVSDGLEESGAAVVSSSYSGLATLKQLMGKVAQEAKTHFRCARCTVYVCDHKAGELWSLVAQGVDDTIRIPIGSGVAGACALSGRKVNVKDALSDPRVRHDLYDFELRTVLCLPILARGARRAIGVLQLLNKVGDPAARLQQMLRKEEPSRGSHRAVTPCSFTAEDEEDVRGFCQIVGAALQSTGTSKTPDHMAPGGLALRLLMGSGVGLMAAHSMTQRRSSLLSNAFKGSGDESREAEAEDHRVAQPAPRPAHRDAEGGIPRPGVRRGRPHTADGRTKALPGGIGSISSSSSSSTRSTVSTSQRPAKTNVSPAAGRAAASRLAAARRQPPSKLPKPAVKAKILLEPGVVSASTVYGGRARM